MTRRITGWMGSALLVTLATAAGCSGGSSCGLVGSWKGTASNNITYGVTFLSDGTYTSTANGQPATTGGWALSGSTFTFTDGNNSACPPGTATYTVTFDASCNVFTFSNPADTCTGRSGAINGLSFTRQ